MTIRRLAPEDAPSYRALMLEAYAAHPDAFTSSTTERAALPLSWWESRLGSTSRPKDLVWGAFALEELVGVAGLSVSAREKVAHKGTLFGMYVKPRFRGRGLGDDLVEHVLRYARADPDLQLLQLTVTEGNASALRLYRRHGFVEFGVEPLAVRVSDHFVSKIHMWSPLRPHPDAAGTTKLEARVASNA